MCWPLLMLLITFYVRLCSLWYLFCLFTSESCLSQYNSQVWLYTFIVLAMYMLCCRGCHICGSTSHKRRDCPKKNVTKDFYKSFTKYVCIECVQILYALNCNRENGGRKRKWHRTRLSMKRRKLLDYLSQGIYWCDRDIYFH